MNWTAWGLVASIIGALVLGWIAPRYSVTRLDGGPAKDSRSELIKRGALNPQKRTVSRCRT